MLRPDSRIRNRRRMLRREQRTPLLVLGGALALTVAATAFVAYMARDRDEGRFENAVQSAQDRITERIDVYAATLRAGAALFAVDRDPSPEEFRRYVDRLDIQRRYPGIQGIGWSARQAYLPDSAVDERHAIVYLEPLDARNREAIGFDMYAEPTRRAAMARARDRGEPALSGKVRLVQEIFGPEQAGFLLYVPVYRTVDVPATVAERRAELLGFVYSPFRADDLFFGVFGSEEFPRVAFTVHDGASTDSSTLLHASPRAAGHRPRHTATTQLRIAGRDWTVVFVSQPEFEAGSQRGVAPLAFAFGLLTTMWLFGLARSQARARAAAEAANQAKSVFLATMSHELRTPLNAIGGYVDLLRLRIPGPLTEVQEQYLGRVERAQQHLLGLINDVLNFAKLEAGRVEYDVQPLRVDEIVADAHAMVAPTAAAKDIDYSLRAGPPARVLADPEKARQILLNLLSNAVKFTPDHGRIEVGWTVRDGRAEIDVQDSGVGIPPDRLDTIFDPFVQIDPDLTRAHEGTGLGLSISRALAEGMDGELRVRSHPGRGSTFTLALPLDSPDAG